MSQIAFVSDQHNDDVGIRMIPKLFQPPSNIIVCLVFADIVDEQCTNSTPVVGGRNGTISLLACSIPDLSLDGFGVDLDRSRREFDTDRGF